MNNFFRELHFRFREAYKVLIYGGRKIVVRQINSDWEVKELASRQYISKRVFYRAKTPGDVLKTAGDTIIENLAETAIRNIKWEVDCETENRDKIITGRLYLAVPKTKEK